MNFKSIIIVMSILFVIWYVCINYNSKEKFDPYLFMPNCFENVFGNTLCHRHTLRRYPIYKGAKWSYPVFFSPYYY